MAAKPRDLHRQFLHIRDQGDEAHHTAYLFSLISQLEFRPNSLAHGGHICLRIKNPNNRNLTNIIRVDDSTKNMYNAQLNASKQRVMEVKF